MATTVPSCPRCGYDLSGAIASWQETCPLATTCSECGLIFELRLVLNARLRDKARFFEAAGSHLGHSLVTTTRMALRPGAFWRWVVMEYEPSVLRMTTGVALGAFLVESVIMVLAGTVIAIPVLVDALAGRSTRWYPSRGQFTWYGWLRFLTPWHVEWESRSTVGSLILLGLMIQLLMPIMFLLLPQTLRQAKVRKVHLARIGLWSFVGIPMVVGGVQMVTLLVAVLTWISTYLVARRAPFTVTAPEEVLSDITAFLATNADLLFLGVIASWTMMWWGLAVGRYLKLPRPWLVTLAMGIIAVLLSIIVCLFHPTLWYAVGLRF